jgi:iron(III) transport system ATP-binding protein
MLKVENLSISYKNSSILKDINFSLKESEIIALTGKNGSGKSSIFRFITGLIEAQNGSVILNDKLLSKNGEHIVSAENRKIGMVFQDYSLFPHMNVYKNISFGIKHLNKNQRDKRIKKLLQLVNLTNFEKYFTENLSGGEQQRIAIARALAPEPKILLLDEPFSSIDKDEKPNIMKDLKNILKTTKTSAIFITHHQDEIDTLANRTIKIVNGVISY